MVKQNCEIEIKRRREKDQIDRSRSRSVRKRRNFAMQSAIYATKAKVGVKCGREGKGEWRCELKELEQNICICISNQSI